MSNKVQKVNEVITNMLNTYHNLERQENLINSIQNKIIDYKSGNEGKSNNYIIFNNRYERQRFEEICG